MDVHALELFRDSHYDHDALPEVRGYQQRTASRTKLFNQEQLIWARKKKFPLETKISVSVFFSHHHKNDFSQKNVGGDERPI